MQETSFRSLSTPVSHVSLPTRLENTNRSILAAFRLSFFLAFWAFVGCILYAFATDVLNKLEQERQKQMYLVELCMNDYKSNCMRRLIWRKSLRKSGARAGGFLFGAGEVHFAGYQPESVHAQVGFPGHCRNWWVGVGFIVSQPEHRIAQS